MDFNKENRQCVETPKTTIKPQALLRRPYGYLNSLQVRERRNLHEETSRLSDIVSMQVSGKSTQNITPAQKYHISTPLNQQCYGGIKFDHAASPCFDEIIDKTSPGLTRLRMTPGVLKEKQKSLITQHEEIRQKGDQLKTGGGISLWPEMVQMRLTRFEVVWLIIQATILSILAIWILCKLHGDTLQKLGDLTIKVEWFCDNHPISERYNQSIFHSQISNWHSGLLHLTNFVYDQLTVREMSNTRQLYFLTYVIGFATLMYYLLDNMLAHNKLTPSRIKKWTCLLVVIGTWTMVMCYVLLLAHQLERRLIRCIQDYSASLSFLVITPLDLDTYKSVLLYWRSRLLDDASPGIVSVLGVLPVRHLVHYLQFYSVPIVTVILSPVLKLCCACINVYKNGEYIGAKSSY